ncbi:glycoside hydrolase family 43 [Sphingomonas sp. AX6]|uniref:glycoside hydrolase family 43 n=1 Tax=Sphingomonas sp. AX6 TaxID=2653171 RepID=UPI0012F181DA|nr:glycoside hydrolase family 43 [Sphingomonas sp. AX6]VXC61914.1 Glycoside hydrolase family 43 [Sphingomonas sp. AX6]
MIALSLALMLGAAGDQQVAPKPLHRDPVHDGAADASTVYDPAAREWRMFYTNRRADLNVADKDVSWVHGTHIGVATSKDGATWTYAGVANIPAACTGPTLWAPEVKRFGNTWHMWLTVVPGVFSDWNAERFIVHLTSGDLKTWTCGERLNLGSDRVIDASVVALPSGGYRLWFNDERLGKAIRYADSTDLKHWQVKETVVETPGEGPKAFRWKSRWWLVSDAWKGLLVMRSEDAANWTQQADHLLAEPGTHATDRAKGQHPDVIVSGDHAYLIYFVHQSGEPQAISDPNWHRRSVLQIVELNEAGGIVTVDRNATTRVRLTPPEEKTP